MKTLLMLSAFVFSAGLLVGSGQNAFAGKEEYKNLKILKDNGKDLEKGMKELSKGLGVKCNACHVKGDFASDKVAAKEDGRAFLKVVLDEKDQAKRDQALSDLLKAMKLKSAKKSETVWEATTKFAKK